jgi:hypothetical protein
LNVGSGEFDLVLLKETANPRALSGESGEEMSFGRGRRPPGVPTMMRLKVGGVPLLSSRRDRATEAPRSNRCRIKPSY